MFVHVPKVAGFSISRALELCPDTESYGTHTRAVDGLALGKWDKKPFVFAFVRNPWDRAVSEYFYNKTTIKHPIGDAARKLDFQGWLEAMRVDDWGTDILKPQSWYLVDDNDELLTDYVGRFEHLREDFNHVGKVIGADLPLPHVNKTKHDPFMSYYNKRCIDLVQEWHQDDIKHFGFQVPIYIKRENK